MTTDFLASVLQTITERGRALIGFRRSSVAGPSDILRRIDELLSGRGEASGVALAQTILTDYMSLSEPARIAVLIELNDRYGPDMDGLKLALAEFSTALDGAAAARLYAAAEPRRHELIRRLNLAPGGTQLLVQMREDLQRRLADQPQLATLDRDFIHLFSAWFNRGFLVLRRINWSTPANILEKIIRYEAVHAIADWSELRRRLEPSDRRLYAFFHPALVDEPLIFVEVALTDEIPDAIAPLLSPQRRLLAADESSTAVFYSISNTQRGLAGVSFGSFLIKQVVEELKRELPRLETFVTLSPVPSFARWLRRVRADEQTKLLTGEDRRALALLDTVQWFREAGEVEAVSSVLLSLAAHYFVKEKRSDGRPIDPVARFHLGNGARLERLNFLGDLSPTAMQQSHGLMVNYRYALEDIEANHESFANRGEVAATGAIRRLAKGRSSAKTPRLASSVKR